jgi:hypothetical protein
MECMISRETQTRVTKLKRTLQTTEGENKLKQRRRMLRKQAVWDPRIVFLFV